MLSNAHNGGVGAIANIEDGGVCRTSAKRNVRHLLRSIRTHFDGHLLSAIPRVRLETFQVSFFTRRYILQNIVCNSYWHDISLLPGCLSTSPSNWVHCSPIELHRYSGIVARR